MFYATILESELKVTLVICPPLPPSLVHSAGPVSHQAGWAPVSLCPRLWLKHCTFWRALKSDQSFFISAMVWPSEHSKHPPHAVTLFGFCDAQNVSTKELFFSCLYLPKNNFDFFLAFLSTFAMIVYMQLTRLECRLWCRLKTHRLKAWRLESSKLWIRLGARGFEASAPNCRLEACGLDASKQGCRLVAGRLDWMLGNQVCKYQGYLSSVLEYTKGNYIWKTNIVLQHSFEVSRWIVFAKMLWWPYLKSMFEFLNVTKKVRFIEF